MHPREVQLAEYFQDHPSYQSIALARVAEWLDVQPVRQGRLLDLGCGDGRAAGWATTGDMQYHGVDTCYRRLTAGQRAWTGLGKFFCRDGYQFCAEHPPGTYDIVLLMDVLHRVTDPVRFLAGARRMLRFGGTLLGAVPLRHYGEDALHTFMDLESVRALFKPHVLQLHRGPERPYAVMAWYKPPGFIIHTYPRCGTHMLRTALDVHPELTCKGEAFNVMAPSGMHGLPTVEHVLEEFWPTPNHGFCIHAYIGWAGPMPSYTSRQTEYASVWSKIPQSAKIITLRRNNLLRRHVSHVIAAVRKNAWQVYAGDPNRYPKAVRVPIDPLVFREDAELVRAIYREMELRFPQALFLSYEDLIDDQPGAIRRVLDYLCVPPLNVQPGTVKVGHSLREDVENYPALKATFRGTDLEPYFDE